jgi:hypothetical protein
VTAARKRTGASLAAVPAQLTERFLGESIPSMARAALRNVDTLVGRAVSIVADHDPNCPEGRDDIREIARLSAAIRTNLLGLLAAAESGDARSLAEEAEGEA